jgi:hypothetical protein
MADPLAAGGVKALGEQGAFSGWIPFRVAWRGQDMIADWCYLGDKRFVEPFFYETVVKVISHPFNQIFQQRTPIGVLNGLPEGLKPSGFIFHMARCGSTLCAQALATSDAHIVMSEPLPLRGALRAPLHGPATEADVERWLSGVMKAVGQKRFAEERHFFVKFMAADALDLPLITRVFPDVPWLFLYRDPLEILASQQVEAGVDTMPGQIAAERLGLTASAVAALPPEVYQSHLLAALGQAAIAAHASGRGLILHYHDLPAALWKQIPKHFGIEMAEPEIAAIQRMSLNDAKRPQTQFKQDGAAKQAAAAAWRETADRIAGPTIRQLDGLRSATG